MKEEVKKQDPVEAMIATQLERFEVKPEELQAIVKQYSELVVTGVNDKSGRKAVSEARKHLKRLRTGIDNNSKEFRENFNKVSKAIIGKAKELVSIVSPEEERLERIEKDIEEEEEEIARVKAFEEQERIIARTKLLEGYGATFNGVQYQLGDNTITIAEVRLFTDTEFNRVETFFREDYENFEQLKLQAELDRIAFIKELSNDAAVFIIDLGFKPEDFPHKEFETIEELDDFKVWAENKIAKEKKDKIDAENKRIADEELKAEQARLAEIAAKQKAQQDELDRKQKELDDQLASVKAQQEKDAYNAKVNLFESRRSQLLNTPNLIHKAVIDNIGSGFYSLNDEIWISFLHGCKNDFEKEQERLAIEAEETAAAEEKRRAEMEPDVDVLKQIAVDIKGSIVDHKMKSSKGQAVINNINELKRKTITYIEEQIKSL
jgi:hypothetical protein